jgi:membrane-associated phospholipid phosphatase
MAAARDVTRALDIRYLARAVGSRSPLDPVYTAAEWPGYPPQNMLLPPLTALAVGLAGGGAAAALQLAAWGVAPVGGVVKRLTNRSRPPTAVIPIRGRRGTGPSLPSTHVANYVAVYGFAAVALARRAPLVSLGFASLIALIGRARVRAGDQWPSDVIAGYTLGGLYLLVLLGVARGAGVRVPIPPARVAAEDGAAPIAGTSPSPATLPSRASRAG